MARQVRGWDALRAWRFIRASRAWRDAWAKRRHLSGLPERAPFPVRLQTAADLAAMAVRSRGDATGTARASNRDDADLRQPYPGRPRGWRRTLWRSRGTSENDRNETSGGGNAADRAGEVRKTRGIPFSGSEREEVKRAALAHDKPAAEFVRERILALARAREGAEPALVADALTPLIERMFRYTWFLATERRDAMAREGRGDELDRLVAEARAFQDALRRGDAD